MDAEARRNGLAWLGPLGALACLVALAAAAFLPPAAWRAWLGAAFLWSSAPIGALALLMIMRLTPGDWSEELAPFMEAQILLLPLGALLMAPVLIEAGRIYPWAHESWAQATGARPFRAAYLSVPMFLTRAVGWFGLLFALGFLVVVRRRHPVTVASIGLIVIPVLGTLISTDWLLSLDPGFASSGFGLYVLDIQMLTALALALAALAASGRGMQRPGILGGLLLCLLLLWSYFAFMHFVITWSNNLPPGVRWYQRRGGGWGLVMWAVAATRLVPTFLLLFQTARRSPRVLLVLSLVVVLGSVLELAWLALPSTRPELAVGAAEVTLFALANLAMAALLAGGFARAFAWRAAWSAP